MDKEKRKGIRRWEKKTGEEMYKKVG